MADFEEAMKELAGLEKGLANWKGDPGGITNYGVSLKFLKEHAIDVNTDHVINQLDVRALTPQKAADIFLEYFWNPMQLGEIHSQAVANQMFDLAANAWTTTSARVAQRALVDLGVPVSVDGVVGPATVAAINAQDPQSFLGAFKNYATKFYAAVVYNNPTMSKFLHSWMSRLTV